jgi:hypothetical protein
LKGGSFSSKGTQMERALKAMTRDSPVHTHPSCAAAAAPTPPAAAGANTGPRPVRAANWDPSTMTATDGMAAHAICTEAYLQAACRNTRHAVHDGDRVDSRFCLVLHVSAASDRLPELCTNLAPLTAIAANRHVHVIMQTAGLVTALHEPGSLPNQPGPGPEQQHPAQLT